MRRLPRTASLYLLVLFAAFLSATASANAQSAGSAGTLAGFVTDTTGAAIPGASITITNSASGLNRQVKTDPTGHYQIINLPLSTYNVVFVADGFAKSTQSAAITSFVPLALNVKLEVSGTSTEIDVDAAPAVVSDPNMHSDIDRASFEKLPLESASSPLSSLVTLSSPGVTADSDGLFHGMGDHASNTFNIDGQNISDQQSKVFSNQIPSNSVQSIEVIDGAPPAEYGGKTSLVIQVTTRSGQGVHKPTGAVTVAYGTFGSISGGVDLAYGTDKWGNFIEVDGLNTGRFLDGPEFAVFHDKGNELSLFDRIDRQITEANSIRLNINVSRSWFLTPNTYDNLGIQNVVSAGTTPTPVFAAVGNADQRSKILTYNLSPTYSRTIGANTVFNLGVYLRRDGYNYYPSNNPLADLGPIQNESIAQQRSLTNAGVHSDVSYVKGINTAKFGLQYTQTFLRENDQLGIVNSTFNSPCNSAFGVPQPGLVNASQCTANADFANTAFKPQLEPFDLTRGGHLFSYFGHTDVKELALYAQDQIKTGNWLFNVGARFDGYNGLAIAHQFEPRLGISYTVKRTHTVLRTSYARTLESPFNENLVLSSQGCASPILAPLLNCNPGVSTILQPGFRNEFHVGLSQPVGKHFVVSGDYIWKYTHNAFDFSVLGNTPITFPIDWHNSKVPGFALRMDVPNIRNFSAFVVMSSVAARFFTPQVAGAGSTVANPGGDYPFRIDHDERFNQTTHFNYQFRGKYSPWIAFNWRFDSGLVAAATPCYGTTDPNSVCRGDSILINGQPGISLAALTADQEAEAGLACNGVAASLTHYIPQCLATQLSSTLLNIPSASTEDDDHNPPRIKSKSLFDASMGEDNLFHGKEKTWSIHLTAVNLANKEALYNYLSTFSGTHYITPRTLTAELAYHF